MCSEPLAATPLRNILDTAAATELINQRLSNCHLARRKGQRMIDQSVGRGDFETFSQFACGRLELPEDLFAYTFTHHWATLLRNTALEASTKDLS
ncbi:hypothetical protein CEXT_413971 [Caerostris extrusa]|uniref:Uncharacterized protein n=1 Tax=Caerostris extrusa TaxID=172846 RepID=A0AAV4YAL7_CAEEX|nr:hypothetical protein CEXT_413971 [Caerostris extrusa]